MNYISFYDFQISPKRITFGRPDIVLCSRDKARIVSLRITKLRIIRGE